MIDYFILIVIMDLPKISVIVAVYKAENYLHFCIDSLLSQTFHDFEILLIDDGSPDNSGKICDEYAKKDIRIRAFHKENGGVASARQCGIEHARGEYVTHVDPDDWIEPVTLEDLYTKAKIDNADMVFGDLYIENEHELIYESQKPTSLVVKGVLSDLLVYRKLRPTLCGRLVRLTCYKKNNISFPLKLKWGEDLYVLIKLLCQMERISYLAHGYYHYNRHINVNSLSRNRKDIVQTFLTIYDSCEKDLYKISPKICYAYFAIMAYDFFVNDFIPAATFSLIFRNKIDVFIKASVNLKIKFFLVLSAIGYKDIAYKIYKTLKKWMFVLRFNYGKLSF